MNERVDIKQPLYTISNSLLNEMLPLKFWSIKNKKQRIKERCKLLTMSADQISHCR